MADRPLIADSLALLNFGGLIIYKNGFKSKLRKASLVIFITICYIDVLLHAAANWNEPASIENVLICFGYSQVVVKMLVYNSQYILLTLKEMEKFFPINKDVLQRGTKHGKMFSKIKMCLRLFLLLFIMVITLFAIKPFLFAEKQLPFGSIAFDSKKFPAFEIGYFCQMVLCLFVIPVQVGFDILYISMVTNIVYEFRLLKRNITELPISRNPASDAHTLEVLRNLINHHNVIFNCSRALRRAYYIPFLCIFLFNMVGIGFCLICIIANGSLQNIGISILYGTCTVFYIVQLFLYCAPGTILITESTEVSDVIFDTDWWIKTQPQLRKAFVRILQRANKPVLLSAGGMVNVTLQSFTAIVKNTVSLFTCVLAMYKKA